LYFIGENLERNIGTIAFWNGKAVSENDRLLPGKGRFRVNPKYQAFKESVAWVCKDHAEHFDGPVSVRLSMILNPRMDAQNIIKPILDALELAGVINNDKQVRKLSFTREDRAPKEKDNIMIIVQKATITMVV